MHLRVPALAAFGLSVQSALVTSAFAVDRLVPQQYSTIQAAIDASANGDRVLVSQAVYPESLVISGRSVVLAGVPDEQGRRPILDGLGQSRLMSILNADVTLTDFELRGGSAAALPRRDGGGILREGSGSLLVERCAFENCVTSTSPTDQGNGGAIFNWGGSVTVLDSAFRGNRAFRGSAVFGAHRMERCIVESGSDTGGGIFSTGIPQTIVDCKLVNTIVYMVNTNLTMSGTWSCGSGFNHFEISGQLIDLGGNVHAAECDCDGNGVLDINELADPGVDVNGDGVVDACQCLADITGNGSVDGVDLAAVLGSWGTGGSKTGADLDGDGLVAGADLAIVLSSWGPCPLP